MFESHFQTFEEPETGVALTARLKALREELARRKLSGFVVPRADQQQNEYVAPSEERLASAFDPEVQRSLSWKLAVLYETKLGDDERAIQSYRRALDLPGDERPPLEALDRLLTRAHQWRDLAEVLEREGQISLEPLEQAKIFCRLGELRAGELVDLDGALAAYREALGREPSHPGARAGALKLLESPGHAEGALDLLEPLYEADGDHAKVIELAELRLQHTAEAAEKVSGAILDACLEHGGSITGEHGVGVDKSRYMPKMFGADDLDTMQLVRCAFDPASLCNPGKVFPTPRLCGEVPGHRREPHPAVAAGRAEIF